MLSANETIGWLTLQVNNLSQLVSDLLSLFREYKGQSDAAETDIKLKKALNQTIKTSLTAERTAETKNISILLSDLRGFTAMSERYSPLVVIELLNRYFTKMSKIIYKHGGVIDKFMGDSIMVLFGAVQNTERDLTNALACATEMQIAMNEINDISKSLGMAKLYMGIGINTGEVVAGTLGSDIYREYTVIGDQVNLASRVEAHSLRGQILLTENSYQQAKANIKIGDVNEVFVKGKSKPVKMYELIALKSPRELKVPCREVRKSPRVLVDMPLEYQQVDNKKISEATFHGRVIDISYGGMFAQVADPITPFSEIKMNISLSLMGTERSDIYARVLNCNAFNDYFETHMEFTSLDEDARKAIKLYVDQLI